MITPEIDNQLQPTTETTTLPSKTYKTDEDSTAGFVDNLDAIKQAVWHILNIERYSCLIYDDNYGVELEQYIGQDLDYLEVTIEDTLKEALTHDLRITNVEVTNIEQVEIDSVRVDFTVSSIYGNLQMEVNVNV